MSAGDLRIVKKMKALWQLLDDIDTLDDACREHDGVFRKRAREIQKKRWAIYNPDSPVDGGD